MRPLGRYRPLHDMSDDTVIIATQHLFATLYTQFTITITTSTCDASAVASNFAALHLVCVNWQPARLLSPIEVHVHKHLAVDIAHHPVLPLVLDGAPATSSARRSCDT